jgi:elongation factor P
MAIEAGDFRTGLTVIVDGDPWQVIEFMHVKPGKGAAILRTKMRNLKTGSTQERNFNASTKFEAAQITKQLVNFSYMADGVYNFMDMETFEMFELTEEQIGFNKYFLVDSMEVTLNFFDGLLLDISVPDKVELVVAETTPGVKGAPTTQTKDAVTNTGLTLRVPQFIEEGETILVTSADGKYSSRA